MGKTHKSGETEGRVVYHKWKLGGFKYTSDLIASDYMRRWIFQTPWGAIRIHKILRGDSRDHYHDHPFSFTSIILRGGYTEHTPDCEPQIFKPGSVVRKKGEDLHYLELLGKTAWTLVFAGPFYRDWGFMTEDGLIPGAEYDEWKRSKKISGR